MRLFVDISRFCDQRFWTAPFWLGQFASLPLLFMGQSWGSGVSAGESVGQSWGSRLFIDSPVHVELDAERALLTLFQGLLEQVVTH